jgi:hypothetical protein
MLLQKFPHTPSKKSARPKHRQILATSLASAHPMPTEGEHLANKRCKSKSAEENLDQRRSQNKPRQQSIKPENKGEDSQRSLDVEISPPVLVLERILQNSANEKPRENEEKRYTYPGYLVCSPDKVDWKR